MTHWWRAYNEAVNDPKLQLLSDVLFRAWFNLMCIASANEGALPSLNDLAFTLRMKPEKVGQVLTQLCAAGLLDKTETGFEPHNWNGRQYKTDVTDPTNAARQKRYRNAHRNGSNAVTDKRPETEQKQNRADTDARDDLQKRSGNFRQAIVKAFEAANSPTAIETSRAELWLSQGYQEDICLAVIAETVRKKPSISSLSYFDKQIAEAHTQKAPKRDVVHTPPEQIDWDKVLQMWKNIGVWSRSAGPDLDSPACKAPKEMLAKYGLVAIERDGGGQSIVTPQLRSMQ